MTIRHGLKNIELNPWGLNLLNHVKSQVIDKEWYKDINLTCRGQMDEIEKWTGVKKLHELIDEGTRHDGFPEVICAHSFGAENLNYVRGNRGDESTRGIGNLQQLVAGKLMLRKNALFAVYPPGGYISWHNNANASAYNFIFTWSESGQGWFKYWDIEKQEMVVFKDKPGWQCKAGYFGSYQDPHHTLCYHAARTDCLRMTVAFTLTKDEMGIQLQDQIIEEISA